MRVLDVVDRILVAALLGELEVKIQRLVVAAHQVKKAAGIVADFGAQLPQRHELRLALAHGDFFRAAEQAHELDQRRLQAIARLTHGDQTGAHARDVTVVVGAEDVDEARKAALALFEVVGDIGGEVGLLAVLAHHHAILFIAEFGGAEPGGAVLHHQPSLLLEHREGMIDGAALRQRTFRTPAIEHHAELGEVVADIGEHRGERELQHLAEAVGPDELARAADERVDVRLLVAAGRVRGQVGEHRRRRLAQLIPGYPLQLQRERAYVLAAVAVLGKRQRCPARSR